MNRSSSNQNISFKRIPILGIILIAIGAALFLQELGVFDLSGWMLVSVGLFLYGAAIVIRAFILHDRSKIFFGSLCYLTGLFFILRSGGWIAHAFEMYLSGFLLIFGLAFFMLFVFNVRDWHILIPFALFTGLGAMMMVTQLGWWYAEDVIAALGSYWPVILIVLGVYMIFRKKEKPWDKKGGESTVTEG